MERNVRSIRMDWLGEGAKFTGRGTVPETPSMTLDGDGQAGPSPMQTLLLAAAGCSGADVVAILAKMRVTLSSLSVEVTGERVKEDPKRYIAILYRYTLAGDGLDRKKAERAVSLSLEKYCSVVHSLASDIDVDFEVTIG